MHKQLEDRRAFGSEAEEATVQYLERVGYQVRARNYRCREGEIDIIAEKDDTICFVEVRMRSTAAWGDPSHTVVFSKQRKIVKTALRYLFEKRLSNKMVRFDVVSVVGRKDAAQVEHIPNAFDAGM